MLGRGQNIFRREAEVISPVSPHIETRSELFYLTSLNKSFLL